jgi:hypothetical protein
MPKKLYIYDKDSFQDRMQAAGRFDSNDTDIVTMPVGSMQDVLDGLDKLLAKGAVFDRMLIQTHGNLGRIWFGDDVMWSGEWKKYFDNRHYDKLFPTSARIYFDGCDVAKGGTGEEYLRVVGRIFLKGMGGEVIGWTSSGLGLPGWWPFVGGHTVRITGHIDRIKFDHANPDGKNDSDGSKVPDPPSSDPSGNTNKKVWIGNKV